LYQSKPIALTKIFSNSINKKYQYIITVLVILIVSVISYFLSGIIGYRVVAYLLLVTLSILALFFDIFPVLLAAFLSALIWDFFFIPPHFTFRVDNTEDAFLLIMYFIIAMVHSVLTFKIRQIQKEAGKKEEKANTLKLYNTLLNSLSHELRTPIATIIGASDNLLMKANNLTEENKSNLLSEISVASLRLNQQVENLLNMSRLESGFIQIKKDWCDINEVIYAAIKRLEENIKEHVIDIDVKENLPLFKLDVGLMEQVLYNLIYNAVIYTPVNSVITIKADCINESCVIIVTDNGKGFPSDEIEKVFEKFYRLKYSKTGGTGLGLSIAKGFVEAHHGTIRLENNYSGGAKFTITIPTETSYLKP
jgi:two-component system sensor histidine kinase KdpD